MSDNKKKTYEVNITPWHMEELPLPASAAATDREYIPIAGQKASVDAWATLRDLLERDDGSRRVGTSEAARRLGVSPQQLYRWLAGPTNMRLETAGKVAAALEANLEIVAVPWENLEVQKHVHSFSSCRLENKTTAVHFTVKITKDEALAIPVEIHRRKPQKFNPSLRFQYSTEKS